MGNRSYRGYLTYIKYKEVRKSLENDLKNAKFLQLLLDVG